MDPETLGRVMLFGLGGAGGAWALYQLVRSVFGQYAKQKDLDAANTEITGLRTRMHDMSNSVLTRAESKEYREQTDKLLEDRRKDVIDLHGKIDARTERMNGKIDDLKDAMNQGFSDIKDLLLRRQP